MTIKKTVQSIQNLDSKYFKIAEDHLNSLTKPPGSLGRLEEIAARVVAIQKNQTPSLDKKIIFTFAGDHGVTEEGVSAFPKEVTPQMVLNFLNGGAAINVLAKQAGAEVAVVDVGVDYDFKGMKGLLHKKVMSGTQNMAKGAAMTRNQAESSIEVGIELAQKYAKKGYKLFGTGEMGIGNTTPSSAIVSLISGVSPMEVTGNGTGINEKQRLHKAQVIEKAIQINQPDSTDPIDVLSKIGGTEIGAIAGLCLGAAAERVALLVDGFISTAGALIAITLEPKVKEYLFFSHKSVEKGHNAMFEQLSAQPILDLDLRLGEGTGAALAMNIMEGAIRIYNEMATFAQASVSGKND